jgi:hypothetical protein
METKPPCQLGLRRSTFVRRDKLGHFDRHQFPVLLDRQAYSSRIAYARLLNDSPARYVVDLRILRPTMPIQGREQPN